MQSASLSVTEARPSRGPAACSFILGSVVSAGEVARAVAGLLGLAQLCQAFWPTRCSAAWSEIPQN